MLSYEYHYFDPRGIEKDDQYILLAGNECTKFYKNKIQWLDSIRSTKEGERWYTQQSMVTMGEVMNRPKEEREAIIKASAISRPAALYVVKDKNQFKV